MKLEKALTETLKHLANMLAKSKPDIKATAADWRQKVEAVKNGSYETYYGKACALELLERIEGENFEGGMDREDIGKMMDLLYQIMVKELMQAGQLRKPPEVERKPATPTGLPAHLYLVGRLRGYNKDEVTHQLGDIKSAVEETKSAPSLKNTRVKVRSGRSQRTHPSN